MTKQDYVNQLVGVAYRMDEKCKKIQDKTSDLKQLATMARQGKKETQEFIQLSMKVNSRRLQVISFDNEMLELQKIVKNLKRFNFNK